MFKYRTYFIIGGLGKYISKWRQKGGLGYADYWLACDRSETLEYYEGPHVNYHNGVDMQKTIRNARGERRRDSSLA